MATEAQGTMWKAIAEIMVIADCISDTASRSESVSRENFKT